MTIMKPIVLVIIAGAFLMMLSCKSEKNEDVTNTINKDGSVETDISVQHLDSLHDVLITKHKVWTNYNTSKSIEYRDTIPSLGSEYKNAENEEGDTKSINIKKAYEIFITVK